MIKTKKFNYLYAVYWSGWCRKNLFIISNYLIKKVENLSICTLSKDKKNLIKKLDLYLLTRKFQKIKY